jgi:glycerol-3-phosphate dehydrogenase subunit C
MNPLIHTQFEHCTKCAVCTEYCPVSEVNPCYPGPKRAGPDGERLRLKDPSSYDDALKLCTNCKRCEVACPSGVAIADIIQLARKRFALSRHPVRDSILSGTDMLGALAANPLAPVSNALAKSAPVKKLLELTLGIPASRRFPTYASAPFRRWFASRAAASQRAYPQQVAFFHGCFVNYNDPGLGKDLLTALNACGVGVQLLAEERCCGVPLMAGGFFDRARKNALINSRAVEKAANAGLRVTALSSTCAMTLRDEYPALLDVENSAWRGRIVLATRLLHDLLAAAPRRALKPLELTVAYHTACHMEKLGWAVYAIALLRMIPGLNLRILPSRCCGIAGTYGFKRENHATSQHIGEKLFTEIRKTGADLVVTECETCRMQIEMSAGVRCAHPVSLLARTL